MLQEKASTKNDSNTTSFTKKRSPVFPKRLYDMLENAEKDGYDQIISWLPDGSGFKIHKDTIQWSKADENEIVHILKKVFNQSRYKSFLRQLQLYGFERQLKGKRRGEFKHIMFVRGQRDLLNKKSIEDFQVAASENHSGSNISSSNGSTILPILPSMQISLAGKKKISNIPIFPSKPLTMFGKKKKIRQVTLTSSDEEEKVSACSVSDQLLTDGSKRDSMSWIPKCLSFDESEARCSYIKKSVIPTKLNNLVLGNFKGDHDDALAANNVDYDDDDVFSVTSDFSAFDNNLEKKTMTRNGSYFYDVVPCSLNESETDIAEWETCSMELEILEKVL